MDLLIVWGVLDSLDFLDSLEILDVLEIQHIYKNNYLYIYIYKYETEPVHIHAQGRADLHPAVDVIVNWI